MIKWQSRWYWVRVFSWGINQDVCFEKHFILPSGFECESCGFTNFFDHFTLLANEHLFLTRDQSPDQREHVRWFFQLNVANFNFSQVRNFSIQACSIAALKQSSMSFCASSSLTWLNWIHSGVVLKRWAVETVLWCWVFWMWGWCAQIVWAVALLLVLVALTHQQVAFI